MPENPSDVLNFTATRPGEIDGEPDEVADLVKQQLREFAKVAGIMAHESYVQLRSAGLTGLPGQDAEIATLEAWMNSEEGQQAAEMIRATKTLMRAVAKL